MVMAMAVSSSVVHRHRLSPSPSPSSSPSPFYTSPSSSSSSINSHDPFLPSPPPPSPPSSWEYTIGVNPKRRSPEFLPSSSFEEGGASCGRFQPSPTKPLPLPDSCIENGCRLIERKDCGCLCWKKETLLKPCRHLEREREDGGKNCNRLWLQEASPKPRHGNISTVLLFPDSCMEDGRNCGCLQKELWTEYEMEDRANCCHLEQSVQKSHGNIAGLLPVMDSCTENGQNCGCLHQKKELWMKPDEHPDFEREDREISHRLWLQEASLKPRRNTAGISSAPDSCTENGWNCDCLQRQEELWLKPVRHPDFEMEDGENRNRSWLQEALLKPSRHAGRSLPEYELENGSNCCHLQQSLQKSCRNIAGRLSLLDSCTENEWNCGHLQHKKELWLKHDGHPDFEREDGEKCCRYARRLLPDSKMEDRLTFRCLQQRESPSPKPRHINIAGMLPPPDFCTENGRNCGHFRPVRHPGRSLLDFTTENGENYSQLWLEKPSLKPSRHAGRPLPDSNIEDILNYHQSQKMDFCTENRWNCGHLRPARGHLARSLLDFTVENGENDSELWQQQGHPSPSKPNRQAGRRSSLPDSKTEEDRMNHTHLIQRQDETNSIPLRLPPYLQQQVNCLPSSSSSSTSPLRSKKSSHMFARSNSANNTSSSLSLFLPSHSEQKKKKLDRQEKAKDDPFLAAMELCTKEEEEEDTTGQEESSMSFYNMPSKMMRRLLQRKLSLPHLCSSVGLSQIQSSKIVVKLERSNSRLRQRGRLQWMRIKSVGDELWHDLELGLKLQGIAKKLKEAKSIALSQTKPISTKCEQLFAQKREFPSPTTTQKKKSSSCQGAITMDHNRKVPSNFTWKGSKKMHEI